MTIFSKTKATDFIDHKNQIWMYGRNECNVKKWLIQAGYCFLKNFKP